jgi:AbrB family looped-hinge helix DNA binding protein
MNKKYIKRVDDAGFVAIPRDIRLKLDIKTNQKMIVTLTNDNKIIITKEPTT